jgi:hypothetical protein
MAQSGQVTVTTAGTAVRGDSEPGILWAIRAHPDNSGAIFIGDDGSGDVSSTTGYALDPGDGVVLRRASLSALWFDAENDGNIACWLKLN